MFNIKSIIKSDPGIVALRRDKVDKADQRVFIAKVDGTTNAGRGRIWVTAPAGRDANGYMTESETFKVYTGGRNFFNQAGLAVWIGRRHGVLKIVDIDDVQLVALGANPTKLNFGQPQSKFLQLRYALRYLAWPISNDRSKSTKIGVKGIVYQDAYGELGHAFVGDDSSKPNLATHIPGAGLHCIAMIFLRPYTNTFHIYSSTPQALSSSLDLTDYQECVDQSYVNEDIPGQAFKLSDNQTYVDMTHLGEDLRQFLNVQSRVGFPTDIDVPHLIRAGQTVTTGPDLEVSSGVLAIDGRLNVVGSQGTGTGESPLTTKGDLFVYDTGDQRLAVGNDGQILVADSGQSVGVGWQDVVGILPGGRLTTATGESVRSESGSAQSDTLYYTPHLHKAIPLYDGTGWKIHTTAEISITNSGLSADTNYDVFAYDNSGTVTLELLAWTNATTRATALTTQDGLYVKSGATTRLYLGTIRTDDAGYFYYSKIATTGVVSPNHAKLYVWNLYNQVPTTVGYYDRTNSWTYGSSTWRQLNADTDHKIALVQGLVINPIYVTLHGWVLPGSSMYYQAILYDTTSTPPTGGQSNYSGLGAIDYEATITNTFADFIEEGFHYLAACESSVTTATVYGDNGQNLPKGITGMYGIWWC